jgi:hypothetical protein
LLAKRLKGQDFTSEYLILDGFLNVAIANPEINITDKYFGILSDIKIPISSPKQWTNAKWNLIGNIETVLERFFSGMD